MKHFIAIVSSEYLRDAQIYNAPTQPSFDEAAEDDWVDFSGPGVVWNGHADTTPVSYTHLTLPTIPPV